MLSSVTNLVSAMSDRFQESIGEVSFDWANAGGSVFTGIVSMTVFSQDGSRSYFPVNQAFAYTITDNVSHLTLQTLRHLKVLKCIADVPYAEGFYFGDYYFGLHSTDSIHQWCVCRSHLTRLQEDQLPRSIVRPQFKFKDGVSIIGVISSKLRR